MPATILDIEGTIINHSESFADLMLREPEKQAGMTQSHCVVIG